MIRFSLVVRAMSEAHDCTFEMQQIVIILLLLMLFVLGAVPGPVLFGFAMDHSCVLWEKQCDGSTGSCLFYDNHYMAWLLLAVCVACKVLVILCGLVAWRTYTGKQRKGTLPISTPTNDGSWSNRK